MREQSHLVCVQTLHCCRNSYQGSGVFINFMNLRLLKGHRFGNIVPFLTAPLNTTAAQVHRFCGIFYFWIRRQRGFAVWGHSARFNRLTTALDRTVMEEVFICFSLVWIGFQHYPHNTLLCCSSDTINLNQHPITESFLLKFTALLVC